MKLRNLLFLTFIGVLMYVSQLIMAPLPNIEIVSILIIVTARKFYFKSFLSVYIFVGCEILTYGFSLWVINYLYVWAILCFTVCMIRKINSITVYALLSAVFGLFFGIFCSLPYFIIGGISGGIAYITAGLLFDILHCVGNFIVAIILYKPLTLALEKAIK